MAAFGAAAGALGQLVQQLQQGQQQLQQGMQQLQQGVQQLQAGQQQQAQQFAQLQAGQAQQIAQLQAGQQQILQQLAAFGPGAVARAAHDTLLARAANLAATAGTPLVALLCANGAPPASWPAGGASRAYVTAGLPIGVVDARLGDYGLGPAAGAAPARRQALLAHLGAALRT